MLEPASSPVVSTAPLTALMAIALNVSLLGPPGSVKYGDPLTNITCSALIDQVNEIHFSLVTPTNDTKLLAFATRSDKTDGAKFLVDIVVSNLVENPTVSTIGDDVHFTINSWAIFKRNWFECKVIPFPPAKPIVKIYKASYEDRSIRIYNWAEPSTVYVGEIYKTTAMCPVVRTKKIQITYKKNFKTKADPKATVEFENLYWSNALDFQRNKLITGNTSEYDYKFFYKSDGFIYAILSVTATSVKGTGTPSIRIYCFGEDSSGAFESSSFFRTARTKEFDKQMSMVASQTAVFDTNNMRMTPITLTCEIETADLMATEEIVFATKPDDVEIARVLVAENEGADRPWTARSNDYNMRIPGKVTKYKTRLRFSLRITGFNVKFSQTDIFCKTPRYKTTTVTLTRYDYNPKVVPFPAKYSNDESKVHFTVTPTTVETFETVSITCNRNDGDITVNIQRYNKYAKMYDDVYKCTQGLRRNCPSEMTWKTNFSTPTTVKYRCYTGSLKYKPPSERPRASAPITLIVKPRATTPTTQATTQPTTAPLQATTETPQESTETTKATNGAPQKTTLAQQVTVGKAKATSAKPPKKIETPRTSRNPSHMLTNATRDLAKPNAQCCACCKCCQCQPCLGRAMAGKASFPVVGAFFVFLKAFL